MQPLDANYSLRQNYHCLADARLSNFFSKYPLKIFKKGQILLLKNEIPSSVCLIESGKVKTYTIDQYGCERIISFQQKGDILPVGFIFSLAKRSLFFYMAYTKCQIRMIPVNDLVDYLDNNISYLHILYIKTAKQLLYMMNRVNALIQPNSLNKVALSLLYIPDQLGINKRPHKPKLKLAVTQQEIANLIGLTRETIGSELKKLQKLKLITYSRNNYTVYMRKLRKRLDMGLKNDLK